MYYLAIFWARRREARRREVKRRGAEGGQLEGYEVAEERRVRQAEEGKVEMASRRAGGRRTGTGEFIRILEVLMLLW
jgi:hypothetical protein